jgi:hypothetical protein
MYQIHYIQITGIVEKLNKHVHKMQNKYVFLCNVLVINNLLCCIKLCVMF